MSSKTSKRSVLWWGLFAGATALAAQLGRAATKRPSRSVWYRALSKPKAQPPAWVFGPVWSALYGAMSYSAFRVFRQPRSEERDRALRLWWTQLALNGAWSPLFFGAHKPRLAMADLVALTVTVVDYTRTAAKVDRPAAWLMAPYLGWLGFAGYLNGSIVHRNLRLAA
jgi:benzodiazapine receptor